MLRFLVLAEGAFGPLTSKTASACIRYSPERVVGVLDSTKAGRIAHDVLGVGGEIPVVGSLEEGFALGPTAILIGIAPAGGSLPPAWRGMIMRSIERGLEIWSGLHFFLADDAEIASAAAARAVAIRDLRRPPTDLVVAAGRVREVESTVVLTVGSDCNIGKMTSALQLRAALRSRGLRVAFAGTGQTGILIDGKGIAVDAVIADFIAGAAERLVVEAAADADIVLVEGQGSLLHPSYSGVTLGLMHGSLPHAMVLCAQPTRTRINNHPWVPIPPYRELVEMHERMVSGLRPAPVIAVALNTMDLEEGDALDAVARVAAETGLPTTDPVRFDPSPVANAIERFHLEREAVTA